MDEAPAYVTSHHISQKKKKTDQNTQFFTSEKLIDLIVIFSFHTNINSLMCIEQPHSILQTFL